MQQEKGDCTQEKNEKYFFKLQDFRPARMRSCCVKYNNYSACEKKEEGKRGKSGRKLFKNETKSL